MKLQRSERCFIAALVCVLAVGGAGYAGLKLFEGYLVDQMEKRDVKEEERVNRTFAIGDTIALDSAEDERPLPSGSRYSASFDWDGCINLTIKRARLCPDLDSALSIMDGNSIFTSYFERRQRLDDDRGNGEDAYIVLDIVLKNISAKSSYLSQSGHPWFSINILQMRSQGSDREMLSFDGMPKEGNLDADLYCFDLAKGASGAFQLVYGVPANASADNTFCYIGAGDIPNKYRIDLSGMEVVGR